MKTLKTIIKLTYFPMLAWMIYAFFNPDTVSNEVVVGFIVYVFIGAIVAAKDKAIGSMNDMTWDDDRRYWDDLDAENDDIYYHPTYRNLSANIWNKH